MAKTKAVLKALATNRATYRFLAAVLLAAGVTAGSQWVGRDSRMFSGVSV